MPFSASCHGAEWTMSLLTVVVVVLLVGLDVVGASVAHHRGAIDDYSSCMSLEKTTTSSETSSREKKVLATKPDFDRSVLMKVDVPLHEPAYLHCRIIRQGDHEVAWTRADDNNLLTVGETSFTSDPRFQVSLKPSVSDWVLIIRRTERRDTGCYLCEVNSEPDSLIYPVFLNVIENDAKLEVNNHGASISLDCTVTIRSDTLQQDFVVWTKNGSVLDTQDGKKYSASKTKRDSSTVVHTLMIKEATAQDAGLYACKADNAPVKQQLVQISTADDHDDDDDLSTKAKHSTMSSWNGQNDAPFSPSYSSNRMMDGGNGAYSPVRHCGLTICLMALLSIVWR
uniref:Ig-like domain-containing protein n=1 Tax=Plectus sambesii TaxID=2011161 RepID=A0A914W442_9BILA